MQVRTATDLLAPILIQNMLGYPYEGDLARSNDVGTTERPAEDRKLWIIGAVLGPVAFALLLICIFCYLHYKCRPRPTDRSFAKVKFTDHFSFAHCLSLGYFQCTHRFVTSTSK